MNLLEDAQRAYLLTSPALREEALEYKGGRELVDAITADFTYKVWTGIVRGDIQDKNAQELTIFKLFLELSKDVPNIEWFNRYGCADIQDTLDEHKDELKEWM